ncbi:MAG: 50S ribosomal protein L6 [Nanoarchaeota archaeon]
MKKEIFKEVEVPEGIEVEVNGTTLKVIGPEGENQRNFKINNISLTKKDNLIVVGTKIATKKEKKLINSAAAHIKNMIAGVQKKFEYTLKVCFSHFPISVDIKGKEVLIKNFLGEKIPRKTLIPDRVEVEIDKDVITVTSVDKELAGQAAADFETATRIRKRDRRIFQDGIFITSKAGREI